MSTTSGPRFGFAQSTGNNPPITSNLELQDTHVKPKAV